MPLEAIWMACGSVHYIVVYSSFISTNCRAGWGGARRARPGCGQPGRAGAKGIPLLPNSSKRAWNFQTPFYRKDSGALRMVYVNFHKHICPRELSGGGGSDQ